MDAPIDTAATLATLLREVPFLRHQRSEVIVALADVARRSRHAPGAVIFLQDEPGDGLYLVESGTVKISLLSQEGREHILFLAQAGGSFNDVSVLDGGPNPATATAHSDAVLWRIARDDLRQVAERYPDLPWAMAEALAGRTRYLLRLVEDLAMRSVKGRLARLLLDEAARHEADVVPRELTIEEMASRLGTVREMVSRVLRSLSAAGIIAFDRHRIVILDPGRLADEAQT